MSLDSEPIVGNWYLDQDKDEKFEVVAVDEDNGTVEIQYVDGDLDEIDIDNWYELPLEPAEAPEDWTGSLDGLESEDALYADAEELARPRGKSRRKQEAWDDEEDDDGWDQDEDEDEDDPWGDDE